MTQAGYSGTPLPRKLGIKPGMTVALEDAPDGFEQALGPLADGATTTRGAIEAPAMRIAFRTDAATLRSEARALAAATPATGTLWLAWPKRASGVPTDITEDVLREVLLPLGLVDTKVCAIDATWSGLRFVVRKEHRADWPSVAAQA